MTGDVSHKGSLPLCQTACTVTISIILVFVLSLEKFLPMLTSSLFSINGILIIALLDASLEKTTIRHEFAAHCDMSDRDTTLIPEEIISISVLFFFLFHSLVIVKIMFCSVYILCLFTCCKNMA